MKPIENANLPQSACGTVIAGGLDTDALETLTSAGIQVLPPDPEPCLPNALKTHADISFLHLGKNVVCISQTQQRLKTRLSVMGFTVCDRVRLGEKYPFDVPLNALVLNRFLICNPDTAASAVISFLNNSDLTMIPVKQGYARCSAAVVAQRAIITEDRGVYASVTATGELDALLIPPGNVGLNGYPYGFIGGCCGKIDRDLLAFNGRIEAHPRYHEIRAFCANHGVSVLSLCGSPLYDNGGILPLTER